MSQTSYALKHAKGYEGQRADSRPATVFPARNNTGAELPFGRFVAFDAGAGSTELAAKLPSAAGDKLLGVSLMDQASNPTTSTGARSTGVLDDDMFSVLKQGTVYVKTEQAVTPADPVFVRHTANGVGTAVGQVRKDADTANAVAAPNCAFAESAAAGEIVGVFLNLP